MDKKLALSIYAAVISTIVFLWRLYEFYDDRRGKIKPTLEIFTEIPVYQNNSLGDASAFLVATIVNIGKYKRLIERPNIQINSTLDGKNTFKVIDFDEQTSFPRSLEPGEKYDYKMSLEAIKEKFKSIKVTSVRAIIKDTHISRYKSKWFKI